MNGKTKNEAKIYGTIRNKQDIDFNLIILASISVNDLKTHLF